MRTRSGAEACRWRSIRRKCTDSFTSFWSTCTSADCSARNAAISADTTYNKSDYRITNVGYLGAYAPFRNRRDADVKAFEYRH